MRGRRTNSSGHGGEIGVHRSQPVAPMAAALRDIAIGDIAGIDRLGALRHRRPTGTGPAILLQRHAAQGGIGILLPQGKAQRAAHFGREKHGDAALDGDIVGQSFRAGGFWRAHLRQRLAGFAGQAIQPHCDFGRRIFRRWHVPPEDHWHVRRWWRKAADPAGWHWRRPAARTCRCRAHSWCHRRSAGWNRSPANRNGWRPRPDARW